MRQIQIFTNQRWSTARKAPNDLQDRGHCDWIPQSSGRTHRDLRRRPSSKHQHIVDLLLLRQRQHQASCPRRHREGLWCCPWWGDRIHLLQDQRQPRIFWHPRPSSGSHSWRIRCSAACREGHATLRGQKHQRSPRPPQGQDFRDRRRRRLQDDIRRRRGTQLAAHFELNKHGC